MKPRPNHRIYLDVLRRMTAEERLLKAFELTESTRQLFLAGLRQRHPELSDEALRALYLKRLARAWSRPA